ncbi:MAG TPA: acyltransferase [Acidimicrobiales bacterium]
MTTATGTAVPRAEARDPFVDFVRAFSLLVVVAWHWVFTILVWKDDGPHATNPIGFTDGLFYATWLLQVMPLFFFVGGYAHQQAWLRARAKGSTIGQFVARRSRQLLVPALAVLGVWVAIGVASVSVFDLQWMGQTVKLILSPLWFLAVYLLLILLLPVSLRLHRRFDILVMVWAFGLAAVVDIVRFKNDDSAIGWLNMILVWGLCHQLGFFYRRLVDAPRRVAWAMAWAGLFAVAMLVFTGFYPGSMVGVPGERFSNMAPPTLCIAALVFFQAGLAVLVRPWVLVRLEAGGGWTSFNELINRFAMPLYLLHTTGMALARGLWHWIRGGQERREPDLVWWLFRPLAFLGALLCTLPVIWLFGRRWVKGEPNARETGGEPVSPTPSTR